MNNGKPAKIVDYKLVKKSLKNTSWLTIIDFKSCLVMFENADVDNIEHKKQQIKVYSCYAA